MLTGSQRDHFARKDRIMSTQGLIENVREYLQAEAAEEDARADGHVTPIQRERVERARQRILSVVNDTYAPDDEGVMSALRDYVRAETTMENCRWSGRGLEHAACMVSSARIVLEDRIGTPAANDAARRDASTHEVNHGVRILVAIDDGQPSEWAMQAAGRLARELGGRLLLVNVVRPELGIAEDFVTAQSVEALHRRQGVELLERAQRTLPPSIESSRMLRTGAPADEIVSAAKGWKAEFIVMGTRGRGRVAQFLLGSTAEGVIRHAPCPVVTVGQEPSTSPSEGEKWVSVDADGAAPASVHAEYATTDK
jgi:nucleotide-binding universal stress UspA family protein